MSPPIARLTHRKLPAVSYFATNTSRVSETSVVSVGSPGPNVALPVRNPVTYELPASSTAMACPWSKFGPPACLAQSSDCPMARVSAPRSRAAPSAAARSIDAEEPVSESLFDRASPVLIAALHHHSPFLKRIRVAEWLRELCRDRLHYARRCALKEDQGFRPIFVAA